MMPLPDCLSPPPQPVITQLVGGLSHFDGPVIVVGRAGLRLTHAILDRGISPLDLHILDPDLPPGEAEALLATFPGLQLHRAEAAGLADLEVSGAQTVLMRFPVTRLPRAAQDDITALCLRCLDRARTLMVELRWFAPGLPQTVTTAHHLRSEAGPLIWRVPPTRVVQYTQTDLQPDASPGQALRGTAAFAIPHATAYRQETEDDRHPHRIRQLRPA